MKKIYFILLILLLAFSTYAQQHLSVPVEDPVYQVIEAAAIKNYIKPLPTSKPYTQTVIINALKEMVASPKISSLEKKAAEGMLVRYERRKTQPWYQIGGYRYDSSVAQTPSELNTLSEEDGLSEETARIQEGLASATTLSNDKLLTTAEFVFSYQSEMDFGAFNDKGVISSEHWLEAAIQGDISQYFSYKFHMGLGITTHNANAYAPYSFSKSWDGYQFPLDDPYSLNYLTEKPAISLRILPELALSFWENKVRIDFSRVRRDWGYGSGNLMLSATARPFMGIDFHLNPVDWFNLSFVVGVLEFNSSGGVKAAAEVFQNAYTATQLELFALEWAYIGVSSSVVWAKRFELGYGNPAMLGALYQNSIGDFDNVQLGLHAGFNVPRYLRIYAGWFIDEMRVDKHFTHRDRNMYSWQLGGRLAVPGAPFTTITLQYTKVEPYMYTHPDTKTPWYEKALSSTYVNHGEPIGYKLDPNSDELKLLVETTPLWYLNASFLYRMIRHGISADGSTWDDLLDYSADINNAQPGDLYWKDFLKDGVYEWIHSVGIEAELDLRFVDVPLAIGAGYTFYYRYLTEYDATAKKHKRVDSFEWKDVLHKNNMGNLFSLYVKVW